MYSHAWYVQEVYVHCTYLRMSKEPVITSTSSPDKIDVYTGSLIIQGYIESFCKSECRFSIIIQKLQNYSIVQMTYSGSRIFILGAYTLRFLASQPTTTMSLNIQR